MADATFEALGGLDVLINNVGDVAREQMSWRDITEESIDHVLGVDIKGTMLCVHEFGSRMLDQGHGAIVNIGSTVIVRGSARAPHTRRRSTASSASRSPTRMHSFPLFGSTSLRLASSKPKRPSTGPTGRPAVVISCGH